MSSEWLNCSNSEIINAQNGDQAAKEAIICAYQPLLWSLAKRLRCDYVGCEELVQAGNIGLLYALERYDVQRPVKLGTYAVPWILGEMRRAIRRQQKETVSMDEAVGEDGQNLHDILVGCPEVDVAQIDLKLALLKLEYDERILVCLRFFRDQTQKEAALLMGKSQAQISRMERRALDALREMLA